MEISTAVALSIAASSSEALTLSDQAHHSLKIMKVYTVFGLAPPSLIDGWGI
jgi:hypothetical protein